MGAMGRSKQPVADAPNADRDRPHALPRVEPAVELSAARLKGGGEVLEALIVHYFCLTCLCTWAGSQDS